MGLSGNLYSCRRRGSGSLGGTRVRPNLPCNPFPSICGGTLWRPHCRPPRPLPWAAQLPQEAMSAQGLSAGTAPAKCMCAGESLVPSPVAVGTGTIPCSGCASWQRPHRGGNHRW